MRTTHVVWNRTLAWRRRRYHAEGARTTYAQASAYLTAMKATEELTWLNEVDPATIDPSTVTVSRDPCGRWYVAFAVDIPGPEPLPATGRAAGVDLGITNFAVNMVQNRRLAKAISDCGWGTFRHMLEYMAARAGQRLIVIDRWYPSSKTRSGCGYPGDACGADVRHSGSSRVRSAVKQELRPVRAGIPVLQGGE